MGTEGVLLRWATIATLALAIQAQKPAFFQSPYPAAEMRGKQAVVATSAGTFVVELLPEAAPNHVGHFMKLARDGAYASTIFHRVIKYGVIQGGDPLTKDPAKAAQYGTGGLNELRAEINAEPMTAGAVAAVLQPGRPDSAGAQFFVCATDQATLQGQYTVFGRVVDGLEIVQQISAVDADAEGHPKSRVVITSVTIRDTPPVPFLGDTPAQLAGYRAIVETTKGTFQLSMLADKAPETVRQFLRLADAGVYDGVGVHRVAPNFVIQTGALAFRAPLTISQQKLVHNLAPEFSDTPNEVGLVSMARGDDPASATTSFFVCIGECHSLDGKYTAFAKVSAGLDVLRVIAAVPVDGETPKEPITMIRVRVEKRPIPENSGFHAETRRRGGF
jgi:cyclophilin family peptidyl-prolyl cis-trans isomerase